MFMANEDKAAGYGRICREQNQGTLTSPPALDRRSSRITQQDETNLLFDLTGVLGVKVLGVGVRFLRSGDHEINRDFGLCFHRLPVLQVRLELPLPEHFARGWCEHRRSAHHAQIFDFAVSAD